MYNNNAILTGTIIKKPVLDHKTHEKNFYKMIVSSKRLSGIADEIPVIFSEDIFDVNKANGRITVRGSYRSFNFHGDDGKSHLLLFVLASHITPANGPDRNDLTLSGTICKPTAYRKTPKGREITDFFIAVNRNFGKSDYIPGICWEKNAAFMKEQPVGTKVKVKGRIQSRVYLKKTESEEKEMTAYEVSVNTFSFI